MQAVSARPDHLPPQLVQPRPGRPVAIQSQHPLEAQGTDAGLLAGDASQRHESLPQRLVGILEDRAVGHRRLRLVPPAAQLSARHFPGRGIRHPASRAHESIRSPQATDVVPAGHLAAEPRLELLEGPRIVPRSRDDCLRLDPDATAGYYFLALAFGNGMATKIA